MQKPSRPVYCRSMPIALLGCLVLTGSPITFAQHIGYYSPPPYVYYNMAVPITVMNQSIKNQALDKLSELQDDKNTANKTTGKTASSLPKAAQTPTLGPTRTRALPYSRDRALSTKLRDAFLLDVETQMPKFAPAIREMSDQGDFIQVVAGLAERQGLDTSTIEGLLAFWFGQVWAVSNLKPLPTRQQYHGIAEQLGSSVTNSPHWRNLTNAQRQTFFEQLGYPQLIQKASYQSHLADGRSDALKKMASDTQQNLKKMGLDLQGLQLGSRGFSKS